MSTSSLPWQEPDILTILILSSFLLLLNAVNYLLDRILYCGLIGQIFIGIAWGVPGGNWLPLETQKAVMQMGYLGLIMIVYEGGLATNLKSLRANLFLSILTAAIGISALIALSFVLLGMLDITALQAFAAGAALCSTSLGTTFTVLSTSGLTQTRLGVILTSAAMMDDIVGLVMVQVISNLGQKSTNSDRIAVSVVRPVCVAIGLVVATIAVCSWVVKPLTSFNRVLWPIFRSKQAVVLHHSLFLLAMVTGASYAGTSNLLAAYVAGASVSWWDGLPASECETTAVPTEDNRAAERKPDDISVGAVVVKEPDHKPERKPSTDNFSGAVIYNQYYSPAVSSILKPFFFASIGFSIPIATMFGGKVIWRGLVYAILMTLGKLLCGICLVRFPRLPERLEWKRLNVKKPKSLYPAVLLGSAMVARGEIGFLISSVAESEGVFTTSTNGGYELFLVVTWAILICTVLGPVSVGLLVRRIRQLEARRSRGNNSKHEHPLGIWGIVNAS